jgi:FixJ family two-component response regulator
VGNDVLLVDDDDDVLDSLADLIALVSKRHVRTARSLAEVEGLNGELASFGLAVLDINLGAGMPSGLDVLRWLRSRHFAARIVFLTGHAGDLPLVKQARATGVEMFSKPIEVDVLRALVEGAPPSAPEGC